MKSYQILILTCCISFLFSCKKENKVDYANVIEAFDNSKDAVFDTLTVPEHLRNIVKHISDINTYQTESIGKGIEKPVNFENFKKLVEVASDDELLSLLNNKNKAVAVYASVGLLDRKPELLDRIFQNFLNLKTKIHTENGCIVEDQNPAEPLYRAYFRSLNCKDLRTDLMLQKLDSLIIFNPNSPESLLQEAFRYKIYSKSYRKRIEYLAFKDHNIEAVRYLTHWHKGDYVDGLQKELISIIENDSVLYDKKIFLSELLSFRNPENKKFILGYIKRDTLFRDNVEILRQLEYNGIFPDEYPTK
ncbi:hypothetical protein QFZ37_001539 [Chryseobacterium ginsenosidimutans]|uniref:hypothetical protein n=1 Tax=Chryseobacterium ginsenosidimutans TaxID=687846 RepID=UPI0027853885|nr:hypothetical protein [Chryseobacterium ginsenosidimutans]MDQ0593170.1 hypothetical protein [Chryseobacterium ginsenosidimutans]